MCCAFRGLCDGLITRPGESYRKRARVYVCEMACNNNFIKVQWIDIRGWIKNAGEGRLARIQNYAKIHVLWTNEPTEQGRHCTYHAALWRVRVIIVATETQPYWADVKGRKTERRGEGKNASSDYVNVRVLFSFPRWKVMYISLQISMKIFNRRRLFLLAHCT